jgi:hypothetical protein
MKSDIVHKVKAIIRRRRRSSADLLKNKKIKINELTWIKKIKTLFDHK